MYSIKKNVKLYANLAGVLIWITLYAPANADVFPSLYTSKKVFIDAISNNQTRAVLQRITGITVPHHLIAVDLIAEAFCLASSRNYSRIVILTPDHFSRCKTPFSVTRKDFQTVLGKVEIDRGVITELLRNPLVSESELFSHEHGVQALLPFISHYFPDSRVAPIAIRINSKHHEWESLVNSLAPLITDDTLIVQSTDFSHFLPHGKAVRKDQETLRVLSAQNPDLIMSLTQPDHLDSRAAQYVQMRIQKQVFGSRGIVWANRNSQEYTSEPVAKTTSYIVQIFSPEILQLDRGERYIFAGDTFFGRNMRRFVANWGKGHNLIESVNRVTGGAPLIVNLEGVVSKVCPSRLKKYELCMEKDLTLNMLRKLNVKAVSVANNHWNDEGPDAYSRMISLLEESGVTQLEKGSVIDFGKFRVAAYTDVDNSTSDINAIMREHDINILDKIPHDKPLFAFIHWGKEYTNQTGNREKELSNSLYQKGVELIIGCHSHLAGDLFCGRENCIFFSLGNFVFDQTGPRVSGKILEITFFPQGTYFVRPIDLENYYDTGSKH